jgi:excisionase family DNA binding protein
MKPRTAAGHIPAATKPPAERLLDVHEAAALLGVRPTTLYQWAYKRRLPVVKLFGRRGALRFRESDVLRLIKTSVQPALRNPEEELASL